MTGRVRSLLPREHGAYAELFFPLVTGVALARGTPAAWLFALAAVGLFLMQEPIAVVIGARGAHARDRWRRRALRRAAVLGVVSAAAGVTAAVLAPPRARTVVVLPVVLALVLAPAVASGRVKTLAAEMLVVATFSSALLPVALSGGTGERLAWASTGVWFLGMSLGTVAVHAIKAKAKREHGHRWTVSATPALILGVVAVAALAEVLDVVPPNATLAVLPPALVVLLLSMTDVQPRQLKTVGWSLVTANVTTTVLLVAG